MTQKKLGYVELHWNCPNCGTMNPGPEKVCRGCGAPQPEDVQFEQAEREDLITDDAVKAKVEAGADIHCPYCGTRNPAGATQCSQCAGELAEGTTRATGRVIGAFKTGPVTTVTCPRCGTQNPDTALQCSECGGSLEPPVSKPAPQESAPPAVRQRPRSGILIAAIALAVIVCGGIIWLVALSLRTSASTGVVQQVSWELSIPIEALVPVDRNDWLDQIPASAEMGTCEERVRSVQPEPAENSVEVCGTPYTIDTGSGFGEVVQDCEYHVYDQYCRYSVEEWQRVEEASFSGSDHSPIWPEPILEAGQRIGEGRQESYTIVFASGDRTYDFETSDVNLFKQCQVGSTWTLNINTFGRVVSIEP